MPQALGTTSNQHDPAQLIANQPMPLKYLQTAGATMGQVPTFNGTTVVWGSGGGSGILLQTSGTTNGSQTVLNLTQGAGMSIIDNGSGTITFNNTGPNGSGAANRVAFWTSASIIDDSADFLWVQATKVFSVGDLTSTGNDTRFILDDPSLRTDLYTQDLYVRGYNANVVIFSEATNTYADVNLGDCSSAYGGTRLSVRSSDSHIVGYTDGLFQILNVGNTDEIFRANISTHEVFLGDIPGTGNGTRITVQDSLSKIALEAPVIRMQFLPTYANNAAALGGGLVAGDLYYTNVGGDGILKVVI